MASPYGPPYFLTFNGKKYHPLIEWNDEEGLLHDLSTHAPHSSKKDFKVSFFFCTHVDVCWFFSRSGCMNILVLVHNFWKMLMICFLGFFASYLSIVYQHLLSVLCRLGVVIDGLVVNEVRIFVCVCGYGFFSFYVLYGVQMSLNPWLGCVEHEECGWP